MAPTMCFFTQNGATYICEQLALIFRWRRGHALISILLLCVCARAQAQENVRLEAKVFQAPASFQISKEDVAHKTFLDLPGVEILTAPKMLLVSGKSGILSIQDTKKVPSGETNGDFDLPSGIQFKVFPEVQGNNISFTANISIRSLEAEEKGARKAMSEFSTHEFFFRGSCRSGEPVMLRSSGVHNNRRVTFYLLFTREKGAA